MSRRRSIRPPRNAMPAECVAWARAAALGGLGTATLYARMAGELHRAQGVGRDWQHFDQPGEDKLAEAWLEGWDTPQANAVRRPVATTHAARTAEYLEELEDDD